MHVGFAYVGCALPKMVCVAGKTLLCRSLERTMWHIYNYSVFAHMFLLFLIFLLIYICIYVLILLVILELMSIGMLCL